ncbi:MAG: hypothetical protein Kow0019_04910 [Methanobacteriaceae archaeon]
MRKKRHRVNLLNQSDEKTSNLSNQIIEILKIIEKEEINNIICMVTVKQYLIINGVCQQYL